jgi:hypothetical protein
MGKGNDKDKVTKMTVSPLYGIALTLRPDNILTIFITQI